MSSSNESLMRTPTKRAHPDELDASLLSSPKFIKPSDVFRKRAKRSQKNSPVKSNSGTKRCSLSLDSVVRRKNYSPLKCLQSSTFTISESNSSSNSASQNSADKSENTHKSPVKRSITFSPLMKKLVRSPARSATYFPVVKRNGAASQFSGSASKNFGSLKRPLANTFSRVLDFSENANFFPDKSDFGSSPSKSSSSSFQPLSSQNIDWSLKTKLRLTTNRAVPFHGEFKAIDEATGLTHFVHGVNSNTTSTESGDNFAAELHRHCLVWQHPSLPWVKLFPRAPDLKPGSTLTSTTPIFNISATSTLAESLHSDFCTSLHSLFKLLKSKHCPYFYLCANNFTVIFRSSGVAGSVDAHALITPTAVGLRNLLKEEGVDFTMPFHQTVSSPTTPLPDAAQSDNSCSSSGIGTSDSSELAPEDPEIIDDEGVHVSAEENENILESLGLSQQDFPSMGSGSLRRRRIITSKHKGGKGGKYNVEDQSGEGRMKSLVRVDGIGNCQTLLSLFINHRKICVSNSGAFSGIPPTLLSPIAFHGATLTPIAVKTKSTTATDSRSQSQNLVNIDVIGPILPHTLYGLMGLFGRFCSAQSAAAVGGSSLTMVRSSMRTYDQSASFALEIGKQLELQRSLKANPNEPAAEVVNPTFAVENLEESGLDKRFLTAICTADRQLAVPLADFELTPSGIRYNRSVHSKK